MANSIEPDQTAPSGAVWNWSTLFAYAICFHGEIKKQEGYDDPVTLTWAT